MVKREFLKKIGGVAVTLPFMNQVDLWMDSVTSLSPNELAREESFWAKIRTGYRLKPDYVNLENGYYCITPDETLGAFIDNVREVNYQGSYYMRKVQWDNKANVTIKVSEIIDATKDEVIITRNTTESLDTIIGGYPWKEGDEAVYAEQDYGAMKVMFELQERRHGIKCNVVSVPNHPKSDDDIVKLYASAITPKTRLLMVCHMINITGHILPIRKICDMAHSRGVDVMVDGAHAFAHIDFRISDLDCDYYGASLHKWLSTPLGAGMLYAKKSKISQIWPTFAEANVADNDIRKLNHTGTHPVHTDLTIINAIEFHNKIGASKKEARLRYLQRYWSDQLRDYPGVSVNTPIDLHRSCAIANVGVKGMKPKELAEVLLKDYKVWTVAIDGAGVHGCRITPNVYTNLQELDHFVSSMKDITKKFSD